MRIYPLLSVGARPGPYAWLLTALLALLFAATVEARGLLLSAAVNVLVGVAMFAAIYPVRAQRLFVFLGSAFAAVCFVALWYGQFADSFSADLIALATGFVFFLYAALVNLITILSKTRISTDELAGAISGYLLFGISGGFVFAGIDLTDSGAILNTTPNIPLQLDARGLRAFDEYLYFSFTCLTTLGFGDLVPASPLTRVLAYLEAVIGQIYLTVLVARLVGLHLTHARGRA